MFVEKPPKSWKVEADSGRREFSGVNRPSPAASRGHTSEPTGKIWELPATEFVWEQQSDLGESLCPGTGDEIIFQTRIPGKVFLSRTNMLKRNREK